MVRGTVAPMRIVLATLLILPACSTSFGPMGMLGTSSADFGLKLLRPGAVGRSCRSSVLGVPLRSGQPEMREALGEILALDREGNVVVDAEVAEERIITGLYNRRCVQVRGDLSRTISTITLPAPPGHHAHH
jgi:hypothetical protein